METHCEITEGCECGKVMEEDEEFPVESNRGGNGFNIGVGEEERKMESREAEITVKMGSDGRCHMKGTAEKDCENENCIENEFMCEGSSSSTAPPPSTITIACSTVRFLVPDDTSSSSYSSDSPVEEEEEEWQNQEENGDDDYASKKSNDMTIRLNKVCETACRDLLAHWENSLTNNNVEPKTPSLSHTPPSATKKREEDNETDPMKVTSIGLGQTGRFQFLRWSGANVQSLLDYYAHLAKDLVEVLVFTVILLSFVYGIWLISKFWYARTTRNSQDAIYPVLRTMRITSLAFLFNYPNAQELYEEACLMQNPFYEMNDVSCWPCENVRHMLDFTGFSNFTNGYYQSGIPFIVKDALTKDVHFDDVYRLLKEDPTTNLTSTAHLLSNQPGIETFDMLKDWTRGYSDLNPQMLRRKIHVTWKLNRAQYARMMRTLFQRPYYIPQETEISVQHFLFIDEPDGESYPLPITEFANVFLMQGDGPRLVVLVPVRHCQNVCKPIRVLLEPRDVLYYNWLFWRPIITPVKTLPGITNHTLSITYLGSFY